MVVICYANYIIDYDGGTSEMSNAALHIKLDTNSKEK